MLAAEQKSATMFTQRENSAEHQIKHHIKMKKITVQKFLPIVTVRTWEGDTYQYALGYCNTSDEADKLIEEEAGECEGEIQHSYCNVEEVEVESLNIMTHQEAITARDEAQNKFRAVYETNTATKEELDQLRAEVLEACKQVDATATLSADSEFIKFERYFSDDDDRIAYYPANGYQCDAKNYKSAAVAAGICKRLLKGDEYIGGVTFETFVITPNPFDGGWTIFFK
jgi:hypothetical protein